VPRSPRSPGGVNWQPRIPIGASNPTIPRLGLVRHSRTDHGSYFVRVRGHEAPTMIPRQKQKQKTTTATSSLPHHRECFATDQVVPSTPTRTLHQPCAQRADQPNDVGMYCMPPRPPDEQAGTNISPTPRSRLPRRARRRH
jgi:hypothetical protein